MADIEKIWVKGRIFVGYFIPLSNEEIRSFNNKALIEMIDRFNPERRYISYPVLLKDYLDFDKYLGRQKWIQLHV